MKGAGKYIIMSDINTLSENKPWTLRKILDNWHLVIIGSVGLLTLKIALEQLILLARHS